MNANEPSLRRSLHTVVILVAGLWCIMLLGTVFGLDLTAYGIIPRRLSSFYGVLTAPLIHGSLRHLFSNTLPLLVLGTALLYGYPRTAGIAFAVIYAGSGIGVWIFGRGDIHVGASGVVFGLMFFIMIMGIIRWEPRSIALSCLVFFLYGGMIWGILPLERGVSFEYHFFGALTGVLCAWYFRGRDPPHPVKRYEWEDEEH